MTSTFPLFDQVFAGKAEPTGPPLTGSDLRDSGIQQALNHVERVKAEYVETCLSKIEALQSGTLFTSEDLREMAGDPPLRCENSIAGILKRGASRNLIVNTGTERTAKRVTIHAKKLCLWKRV